MKIVKPKYIPHEFHPLVRKENDYMIAPGVVVIPSPKHKPIGK